MAEQNRGNVSSDDWEFNIDLDSIRAEAEQNEQQQARSLIAQLDEMSRAGEKTDETRAEPDDIEPAGNAGATRVLPAAQPAVKPAKDEVTTEQTVVIPTAETMARTASGTSGRTAGTRPASDAQRTFGGQRSMSHSSPVSGSAQKNAQPPVERMTPRQQKRAEKAQRKREKRLARVERSRQRPKFRFAPVLASLLAITNVVTLGAYGLNYIQTRLTVQEAEASVQQAKNDVAAARDELTQLEQNTIPLDDFTYYVAEYNIMTEFIQEFFDDRIVYKDTTVHYAEIDESLPMNSYDWSFLTWENGRPSYRPDNARHSSLGVDVSYHQGDIDWSAVAGDGIDFAIIRCGYRGYGNGDLVTDSYFPGNLTGALDAGLEAGVYFFSQAITTEEAVEEAEYVLELIDGYNVTMPVVFDMEILQEDARANGLNSSERAEITRSFCDTIRAAGYTPMIYGNTAYYMSKIDFSDLAGEYGIWLAQYYEEPFFPYTFGMWQYTSTGTVAGISGEVDLNLYLGE